MIVPPRTPRQRAQESSTPGQRPAHGARRARFDFSPAVACVARSARPQLAGLARSLALAIAAYQCAQSATVLVLAVVDGGSSACGCTLF